MPEARDNSRRPLSPIWPRILFAAMLLLGAWSSWHGLARQGLMTWDEGVYFDEARYVVQAVNAFRHGGDVAHATPGLAPRMARPLNTALNVAAMALLGIHPWVPAALAGLFGVLCIGYTFVLARRIFGPFVGLMAALLLTVSPYFLQYRRMGLPEAAGAFVGLLILGRLLALREREERRPWLNSLALGLMMGAAFTINTRLGVLVPVVVLFRLSWLPGSRAARRVVGHALAMAAGVITLMLACEAPYRLLSLVMPGAPLVETYFQQLARFASTQQGMGRPPLPLAYLAPIVFLLYFEAPAFVLGLVAAAARWRAPGTGAPARLWRHPEAALLIACILAQFLALGPITPFARYLSWVLPLLMILAARGLEWISERTPPRMRVAGAVLLAALVAGHPLYRAMPVMQARGQMEAAAEWLNDRGAGTVITSDASIATDYLQVPVAELPNEPREARDLIALLGARSRAYVVLDRQQFIHDTFVMTGEEYDRSAGGLISRAAAPQWAARQFRGLFMPFCFEHNQDITHTLWTGREYVRDGETLSIYTAAEALRVLDEGVPR